MPASIYCYLFLCNLLTNLLIAFSQALPCWTYRSCLLFQTFRQDPRFLAEDFGLFWKTIHPLNWYLSLSIVVLDLSIICTSSVLYLVSMYVKKSSVTRSSNSLLKTLLMMICQLISTKVLWFLDFNWFLGFLVDNKNWN